MTEAYTRTTGPRTRINRFGDGSESSSGSNHQARPNAFSPSMPPYITRSPTSDISYADPTSSSFALAPLARGRRPPPLYSNNYRHGMPRPGRVNVTMPPQASRLRFRFRSMALGKPITWRAKLRRLLVANNRKARSRSWCNFRLDSKRTRIEAPRFVLRLNVPHGLNFVALSQMKISPRSISESTDQMRLVSTGITRPPNMPVFIGFPHFIATRHGRPLRLVDDNNFNTTANSA